MLVLDCMDKYPTVHLEEAILSWTCLLHLGRELLLSNISVNATLHYNVLCKYIHHLDLKNKQKSICARK